MRYLFVVLAVLVLLSGVLLAQSLSGNDEIPACTPEEAAQTIGFMEAGGITGQLERMAKDTSDITAKKLDDYMWIWRNFEDIRLRIPNCALAQRFSTSFQRMIASNGFFLGSLGLIEAGEGSYMHRTDEVGEVLSAAAKEMDEYLVQLNELAALAEADE